MEIQKSHTTQNKRFLKLSLRKNRLEHEEETKKRRRSSDLVIIDESFDRLRSEMNKIVFSPIVINDSSEISCDGDLPQIKLANEEPSKVGNVSFNGTQSDSSILEIRNSRPSIGGCWSPAQAIICATPRDQTIPSTPRDVSNESLEQCSIKKIQQSQKKLLSELYGQQWKSIPKLFKAKSIENISRRKLDFSDDDSDKENNIRKLIKHNKELYLTGSDAKRKCKGDEPNTEKKSRKKLYTEKVPNTPDVAKQKPLPNRREVNTTSKKLTGKSVTQLVEILKDKFEINPAATKNTVKKVDSVFPVEKITVKKVDSAVEKENKKRIVDVCVTPSPEVTRLSFMGSLADNVPKWRRHFASFEYVDGYKSNRERLSRVLFAQFNERVFEGGLDADTPILWDTKLRSTAGTATNRLIKTSSGARLRTSSIKLSVKVLDTPQRLRDTLIHEMCHAATWVIDHELRAAHGPLWKKWAKRALQVFPELGAISRCHDLEIHFKYTYKCTKCGYTIKRHSKSLDITKKCCGYCRGTFLLTLNKKNKDGRVVSTPARQGEANDFAKFVKENYGTMKDGQKTHAQVMKLLGEQFSKRKRTGADMTPDGT